MDQGAHPAAPALPRAGGTHWALRGPRRPRGSVLPGPHPQGSPVGRFPEESGDYAGCGGLGKGQPPRPVGRACRTGAGAPGRVSHRLEGSRSLGRDTGRSPGASTVWPGPRGDHVCQRRPRARAPALSLRRPASRARRRGARRRKSSEDTEAPRPDAAFPRAFLRLLLETPMPALPVAAPCLPRSRASQTADPTASGHSAATSSLTRPAVCCAQHRANLLSPRRPACPPVCPGPLGALRRRLLSSGGPFPGLPRGSLLFPRPRPPTLLRTRPPPLAARPRWVALTTRQTQGTLPCTRRP